MQHSVLHSCETLNFGMCNEHEAPHVVYFEHEDLDLLSSYDICMTFQKIVPSLHDICMTCKSSPQWDETCIAMYYEHEFNEVNSSLYDRHVIYRCLQECDKANSIIYHESDLFEYVSLWNGKCLRYKYSQEQCKSGKLKKKSYRIVVLKTFILVLYFQRQLNARSSSGHFIALL